MNKPNNFKQPRASNIKRDLEFGMSFFDDKGNMWSLNEDGDGEDIKGNIISKRQLYKMIDDYVVSKGRETALLKRSE